MRSFSVASLVVACIATSPRVQAAPVTWADFTSPPPVGVPTTIALGGGSTVDITVTTGGAQGLSGVVSGNTGLSETGLAYSNLSCLAIFNGGGSTTVPTTLEFSNFVPGALHIRGFLMVGAVNAASSPITVTSSVAGRVASWSVVGVPFTIGSDSSPITWNASTGEFTTSAPVGNDSKGIVVDIGHIGLNGTITVSLSQHLNDGILFASGEEADSPLDVPSAILGRELQMAAWPNPSRVTLTVSFTLPNAEPATLALFDVLGRCVASQEVGLLGEGWQTRTLILGRGLRGGTYLLRLDQGERRASQKISFIP